MIQKIIAIDGPSGAGKSSLTKETALALDLQHIDSGAIYRTAALIASELFGTSPIEINSLIKTLNQGRLVYAPKESVLIEFNGRNLTQDIRSNSISMMASKVSAFAEVRNWVNQQLHVIVNTSSKICIMEGRDIGSVIFPNAILKIFLTASPQVRAERRKLELEQISKLNSLTLEDILNDIMARDHADTTRAIAPLVCASDAFKIDTSHLSFSEVLSKIILLSKNVLKNHHK